MGSITSWFVKPDRAIFAAAELLLLVYLSQSIYWHVVSSTHKYRKRLRRLLVRTGARLWRIATYPWTVAKSCGRRVRSWVQKLRRHTQTSGAPETSSVTIQARSKVSVTATASVKRGRKSWTKIYLFFSIALAAYIAIPSVADVGAALRTSAIAFNIAALAYLCLFNGWFQNKLIGWFSRNENKAR